MADQVLAQPAVRSAADLRTTERIGAWAGLAFAASFIGYLALVVADGPRFTDPIDDVRQYLTTNTASLRIASFVIVAGTLAFLLPFVSGLARLVERVDPGTRWWSDVMGAAAMVSVVGFLISATAGLALSLLDIERVPDTALQAVWNVDAVVIVLIVHLATGLWVALAGVAILLTSALPRWLGWLGVGLLAPQVAASSWVLGGEITVVHDAAGGIGQVGAFVVWIPAVAIAMLRRHE